MRCSRLALVSEVRVGGAAVAAAAASIVVVKSLGLSFVFFSLLGGGESTACRKLRMRSRRAVPVLGGWCSSLAAEEKEGVLASPLGGPEWVPEVVLMPGVCWSSLLATNGVDDGPGVLWVGANDVVIDVDGPGVWLWVGDPLVATWAGAGVLLVGGG
jgi:hypothetical protein